MALARAPFHLVYVRTVRTGDLTHVNEKQGLCDCPSPNTVHPSSVEERGRSR